MGKVYLVNSIVAKNNALANVNDIFAQGALDASHCLVGDGSGSSLTNGNGGNIVGDFQNPVDPLFIECVPPDDSLGGDLRLLYCSPARNAGTNDSLDISDTLDLDSNPRITDMTVDMGAFETRGVGFGQLCLHLSQPCFQPAVVHDGDAVVVPAVGIAPDEAMLFQRRLG